MSDEQDDTVGATGSQPGHPNLRGPRWTKGESGNPTGVSKYQQRLTNAIEKQETPERVCEVIAAMHAMAMSGNPKGAPAAAKVYLGAVGVQMQPVKVDLSGLSDETLRELADKGITH